MKFRLKNTISAALLVLTALIWGVAFVAQSVGSEHVGPFTFLSSRSLIAGVALLPLIAFRRRSAPAPKTPADRRNLWIGGLLCGCALTVASAF